MLELSFNPRAREGRDVKLLAAALHREFLVVSIHAPVRGATQGDQYPRQGLAVSIHAPVRGATTTTCPAGPASPGFNPRAREGRDPL